MWGALAAAHGVGSCVLAMAACACVCGACGGAYAGYGANASAAADMQRQHTARPCYGRSASRPRPPPPHHSVCTHLPAGTTLALAGVFAYSQVRQGAWRLPYRKPAVGRELRQRRRAGLADVCVQRARACLHACARACGYHLDPPAPMPMRATTSNTPRPPPLLLTWPGQATQAQGQGGLSRPGATPPGLTRPEGFL